MRINATLQISRLQKWSRAFLMLMVCSILMFSDMPTWGKGFALMVLGFFVAYQRLLPKSAPRLVQLIQFDKATWRLLVNEPTRSKKSKSDEGRLISVQGGLVVLVLRFEMLEKNQPVQTNWVIWRDQVNADDWRRLVVLARFWADEVQRIID